MAAYDLTHLSLTDKVNLLRDAHANCSYWWIEVLKESGGNRLGLKFTSAIAMINNDFYFMFKHNSYENCIEISSYTLKIGTNYFMHLKLTEKYLNDFIVKYQITKKQNPFEK